MDDRYVSEAREIAAVAKDHAKHARLMSARVKKQSILKRPSIDVSSRASDLKQDIVLRSIAVIEEGSVLQRNKLLLEHVIMQRHRDKDRVNLKAATL